MAYFMVSRVSRLKIVAYSNVLAGISMLLIIPFYNHEALKLTVVAVGTTCLTISFLTTKLYTGELFPTVVRNVGFAVCSVTSSIGCMISPLLVEYVRHKFPFDYHYYSNYPFAITNNDD